MNLTERIESALNDYHADNADIDVMVELLTEFLAMSRKADESIEHMFEGLDSAIDRLTDAVKVQAE